MSRLRSAAKNVAIGLAGGASRVCGGPFRAVPPRMVLCWHNVLPPGELPVGDRSLHMQWRDFTDQLDILGEAADVKALETLEAREEAVDRPSVAITFDDAYEGAISYGVPEVIRRGLPATVFVAPALLNGASFWWDEIAPHFGGDIHAALRRHILLVLGGRGSAARTHARQLGIRLSTPPEFARGAMEARVAALSAHASIEIASHTWTHVNLAAVPPHECDEDLKRAGEWVRRITGRDRCRVSYPYGCSSSDTERIAESSGAISAYRVDGGWMRSNEASFRRSRFNVPAGIQAKVFRALIAGWWRAA